MSALSPSAQRVQQALTQLGLTLEVVELPDSTRSAAEAAAAIGCTVGQIAKSLIFKTKGSEKPVLVIASGSNRVDEKKIAALLGKKNQQSRGRFCAPANWFCHWGRASCGSHRAAPHLHRRRFAGLRRNLGRSGHAARRFSLNGG